MTGEMHVSEVTREAFPIHFAIADALGGKVYPFDQYQGPFVATKAGRIWVCSDDGCEAYLYNERTDKRSPDFPMFEFSARLAVDYALTQGDWTTVERA